MCARYSRLRVTWYALVDAAKINDKDQPARVAARDRHFESMRAHCEVCTQCEADLRAAFPEVGNRPLIAVEITNAEKL